MRLHSHAVILQYLAENEEAAAENHVSAIQNTAERHYFIVIDHRCGEVCVSIGEGTDCVALQESAAKDYAAWQWDGSHDLLVNGIHAQADHSAVIASAHEIVEVISAYCQGHSRNLDIDLRSMARCVDSGVPGKLQVLQTIAELHETDNSLRTKIHCRWISDPEPCSEW